MTALQIIHQDYCKFNHHVPQLLSNFQVTKLMSLPGIFSNNDFPVEGLGLVTCSRVKKMKQVQNYSAVLWFHPVLRDAEIIPKEKTNYSHAMLIF